MDDATHAAFPNGKPREGVLDTVVCKHCKRPVLKKNAKEHIAACVKSKQEKARKKKEAREAAAKEKARAEKGDAGEADAKGDDDDEIKVEPIKTNGARKSAVKAAKDDDSKKGKKRKAAVEEEDKEPKKKKKKEEPKPKAPKPKGPVDVEKQCGVELADGRQCARSLTCKTHSMGAKRSVPGRSLPYDMLLQAYQKKNQARQHSKSPIVRMMMFPSLSLHLEKLYCFFFDCTSTNTTDTNHHVSSNRGCNRCQRSPQSLG